MVKPLVGEIVVLPFPKTNLQLGNSRPALVVADLMGDDLILCQITSLARTSDGYSVALNTTDFEQGNLNVASYVRTNRLFTVEESVIIYVAAKITDTKLAEVHTKIRTLFGS